MKITDETAEVTGPNNIDIELLEQLLDSLLAEQNLTTTTASQNITNLLRKE